MESGDGLLTYPAKPNEEEDGWTARGWINSQYGAADDNKQALKITVLQWEAEKWTRSDMDVAPEQIFDQ